MSQQPSTSQTAQREEEILEFWNANQIFEQTLKKDAPNGEFVFYDGPPFATGLPHHGSLLSSIIKDVVPRYKTMRGFHVRRRWGWDTHGLPIETLVEKELGLKTKKDILDIGIATFNEKARSMVLAFVNDWKRYVERIGRWVDFEHSYKTMDNTYIESVWWALKKLWNDKKLYEGRKVLMYCPHCETPLAKAEIAMDNTYQDVTETAVTMKFCLKEEPGTYLLAWTTTPWTLPGNVGLAVNPDEEYVELELKEVGSSEINLEIGQKIIFIDKEDVQKKLFGGRLQNMEPNQQEIDEKLNLHEYVKVGDIVFSMVLRKGKELVGLEYEPLFDVPAIAESEKAYKVYEADFVTTDEGTGIVHTAVMYGEDDFELGKREELPMVQMLNNNATYNDAAPALIQGKHIKEATPAIIEDLTSRGLLFEKSEHTHSYPHCYRCGTPLIYNAVSSWFIDIQSVKERMIEENQKINWVPAHLRDGRFGNIVESAPDWTISRNRFWASPLPIWKERGGDDLLVIGSLDELKEHSARSGNEYIMMRHAESTKNVSPKVVTGDPDAPYPLTEHGKQQVRDLADGPLKGGVDLIVASPVLRARETAELLAELLGLDASQVVFDERVRESEHGEWEGKAVKAYQDEFPTDIRKFERGPEGGENWNDIRRRMGGCLYELERTHRDKRILIISHGDPLALLSAVAQGLEKEEIVAQWDALFPEKAKPSTVPFTPLPHNAEYGLDFHRPYIDTIVLQKGGKEYDRIPEVVDCWVESGAMPFAEYHYPFENEEKFERRAPGDFIAEYIAQTRTWFYYMHAMGVLLFNRRAYTNVVSTGTILAENGEKISKSKQNYTDPLVLIDQYGSDALRLYLMGSPVMQSEDLRFRDEDVREMHNRFIGILWNSYRFYAMHAKRRNASVRADGSGHVLDQWIVSRCEQTRRDTTDAMDAFDMPKAVRALRAFVDDYSTWYIRRSRDRIRGDEEDAQYALATQHAVLRTLVRLIAPLAPFVAESIWQGLGEEEASVHLAPWPEAKEDPNEELLHAMASAREAVSAILELRAAAGLRVRQPLSSATLREAPSVREEAIRELIADEVNVKAVHVDASIPDAVALNTQLTDELKREGAARELMRVIQDMRKRAGCAPDDAPSVTLQADDAARQAIDPFHDEILAKTNLSGITFGSVDGEDVSLGHGWSVRAALAV